MVQALQREGPEEGGGARKSREAKAGDWLEKTRKAWEQTANRALERAGRSERIAGRSLADLRDEAHRAGDLERAADFSREPNVHLGPVRYRTIRGGASETVQQAGRVERRNAAGGPKTGGAAGARDCRGRGAAEGDL